MNEPDPQSAKHEEWPRREDRPAGGYEGGRGSGRPPSSQGRPERSGRPASGGRSGGSGRPEASGRTAPSGRPGGRPPVDVENFVYDPRREARRQLARVPLPDDVDVRELDGEVRRALGTLAKDTAEIVGKHLIMAGRLMDTEPTQALAHARAARALAGRVGLVREANGLVAYTAGEWTEALSELRTARRITGDPAHLPVMADCERALGRPDRALAVAEDPQAKALDPAARVELMIVLSGARRDLGQPQAAAVSLEVPALEGPVRPWTARLRYAYADALLECGREDDARAWFARAADVDEQGETDAEDRLMELDGLIFEDAEDPEHNDGLPAHEPSEPANEPADELVAEPAEHPLEAVVNSIVSHEEQAATEPEPASESGVANPVFAAESLPIDESTSEASPQVSALIVPHSHPATDAESPARDTLREVTPLTFLEPPKSADEADEGDDDDEADDEPAAELTLFD